MALVSSSHSDHRIYEPSIECDYPTRQEQSELRSRLLAKIDNAYRKALERLDFRARPSMAARFLYGGGFCFGLLDPVSNIVANTLIPYECGREEDTAGIVTERKLRELEHRSLEGMLTFLTRFFPYLAECEAVRYLLLADADVLVAARIIALDRHMKNFGIFNQGRVVEDAFNMALKCAALAARHPEPDLVVRVWLHISAAPHSILNLLSRVRRRSPVPKNITDLFTGLSRVSTQQKSTGFSLVSTESQQKSSSESQQKSTSLSMASTEPQQKSIGVSMDSTKSQLKNASMSMVSTKSQQESSMYKPWNLAAWRRPRRCSVPYQHTTALKRILLDAIHGFYLKALTLLPAGELQSRYHRSLLTAGHCYGPLDPVSNIILNTIWYDAAFPPTHELEMDMVSSLSLHRIENRSLYGMISFLCTRFHHLDFHQAACCLLHADANLLGADPNLDAVAAAALRRQVSLGEDYLCPWSGYSFKWSTTAGFPTALGRVDGLDKSPDTSVNEAFKAAAIAARHPNPDDQVSLLASCKQKLGSALSLLQAGHPLSSKDVQQLAILLRPESSRSEQPLLPFPLKEYMHEHARISKKVNAVLNASMQMANGVCLFSDASFVYIAILCTMIYGKVVNGLTYLLCSLISGTFISGSHYLWREQSGLWPSVLSRR